MTQKIAESLGLKLTQDDLKLSGKKLLKCLMSQWLNAADSLVEMIVLQLPSPVVAMQYRTSLLYEGP